MAKRRANGEGSIRKRKDGRWEGRYTAGRDPVTGKAIYKNVLGKTQAEVKEKLKSAIKKNSALPLAAGQYTLGQWLDTWMENYTKLQVRSSSCKTYQGFIKKSVQQNVQTVPRNEQATEILGTFRRSRKDVEDYSAAFYRA